MSMAHPDRPSDDQTSLSPWQRFHMLYFRFLYFMVRRVVALWFTVLGSIATLMAGIWVLSGKPIDVNGAPTTGLVARLLYLVAFVIPTILGWLLWRLKPFDPHDKWMKRRFGKLKP